MLLLPVVAVLNATGPMCYYCLGSQSAYCGNFRRCEADEECYTQKYVDQGGSFEFRSGCVKKTVCNSISSNGRSKRYHPTPGAPVVCEACCNRDMCVKYMCASRAIAIYREQICYNCLATTDPRQCKTANYCTHGQVCKALQSAALASHRTGEAWYNQTCCDGNFCNDGRAEMAGTASSL